MTQVLVTGAAGYLGSLLCQRLLEKGHSVTAVDIRPDAEKFYASLKYEDRFVGICGDVREARVLERYLPKMQVIIPLAGVVGAPKCDQNPEQAWSVNFEAIQLLNSMRRSDQRVLFPMTNNGYHPAPGYSAADEQTPWNEGSLYTKSKKQAEDLLLKTGNAVSLRLASLYGVTRSMRWDLLVHTFVSLAVSTKKIDIFEQDFKRSFLHVRDAADAFCFFLEKKNGNADGIYNVANPDANLSKGELARKIQAVLPDVKIQISGDFSRDPDSRDFFIATEKITKAGFSAIRSLETGILEVRDEFLRETVAAER